MSVPKTISLTREVDALSTTPRLSLPIPIFLPPLLLALLRSISIHIVSAARYLGTDPLTHKLLVSFYKFSLAGPSQPEQTSTKLLQAGPALLTRRANSSHPVGSWKILGLANKDLKGLKLAKTNNAVSPEPSQRSAVKVEVPTLPAEIGILAGKDGHPVGKGEPSGSPVVSSKSNPPPKPKTPSDLG